VRSRLFHSIIGVAIAVAPSGCDDASELVPRTADAVVENDTAVAETRADTTEPIDTADAADTADTSDTADTADTADTNDTYTDAPTDADANDGWKPTK